MKGILACPMCGGSGQRARGRPYCTRCAAEYAPTPLQEWAQATGFRLSELQELTGLSKRTVMRAARGQRVSASAAEALARATELPVRTFLQDAKA